MNLLIYLLFFSSGISGLIYEVVWLRILTRILGSTVYATSIILAAFMAGLGLGGYFFGRLTRRKGGHLRMYGFLELGVAVSAILFTLLIPYLEPLYRIFYSFSGGHRFLLTIFQSAIMFLVFLAPTFLMGGTLPVLVSATRKLFQPVARRMGYLYGFNTLGAAIGVLASGLILIGEFGEMITVLLAIGVNLSVALVALCLSKLGGGEIFANIQTVAGPEKKVEIFPENSGQIDNRIILFTFALSGFAAMAYEIVWFRIFQIHLGTSIYAFSVMLAFYLAGSGLGSLWAGKYLTHRENQTQIFGWLQLTVSILALAGIWFLSFINPSPVFQPFNLNSFFLMPLAVIFPVTFLFGCLWPVVSRLWKAGENESGYVTGQIYSFNVIGCILGSLVCGFVFMGALGTRNTILLLATLNAMAGLFILYRPMYTTRKIFFNVLTGFFLFGLVGMFFVLPDPFLIAAQKISDRFTKKFNLTSAGIYYHREDPLATVTVFGNPGQPYSSVLMINGVGVTVLCLETKLIADLPIMLHPRPRQALVICFGMGTTLRSAQKQKLLECEAVDLVPDVFRVFPFFYRDAAAVLANPRVRTFVDDGRNFLLLKNKKYDIIMMDPSPPIWSAGAVNLYSRDFLNLCRARLNPGGIMSLWVMPESASEVSMIFKTFQAVFPNTYVFGGPFYRGFILLGFNSSEKPNLNRLFSAGKNQSALEDLNEWGSFASGRAPVEKMLLLTPAELGRLFERRRVITDNHPYSEFPLFRKYFDPEFNVLMNVPLVEEMKKSLPPSDYQH